ncbi:hypothetical protein [Methylobacterium platani]|uniref:Uncharacterized protein n=2 Tax=Methylobacterium platani TaxID=427683 RepID=A0A179SMW8_9HYPH|nr:hypothetical protein [Methylobacterium platani]KMO18779.1 hypothetical protein SQ03_09700 [Methylobacterium platani JCM 14648]OAS27793.1 hypothetical protein A5481_00235 [Methylobacterium platani]
MPASLPIRTSLLAFALVAGTATVAAAQGINNGTGVAPPSSGNTGSGMASQPPGTGIGGNNPGSMGSTGSQGSSGGNMGPGPTVKTDGPTGSGAPGTGPGSQKNGTAR